MDTAEHGGTFFSMVIKPAASRAAWAHGCVRIADFFMDRFRIPTDRSNTEVRAYLVQHLFSCLQDLMEPSA